VPKPTSRLAATPTLTVPGKDAGLSSGMAMFVEERAAPGPAPRGRPRDLVRSRRILEAAIKLLEQGDYQHLSMDRVAAEAGVSKATIYRWWPTKAHLGLDAVTQAAYLAASPPEPTGDLRIDLVAYAAFILRLDDGPDHLFRQLTNVVQIAADVPAGDDLRTGLAQIVTRSRIEGARRLFETAIQRGAFPAGADVNLLLDAFFGAVFYRVLFRHAHIDRAELARLVDGVLDGFGAA
jgi:AcrR family transcriptional regulator